MRIKPTTDEISIVILGDFNPTIFAPAWFELHGLLPCNIEDAKTSIVYPGATIFEADWLQLHVQPERFQLQTTFAPYIRICDLALEVFGNHLCGTPIRAFGINRNVHFYIELKERHFIGRKLAPIEPWGQWSEMFGGNKGGMTSLTMSALDSETTLGEEMNVTVEPLSVVKKDDLQNDSQVGVRIGVNNHYTITELNNGQFIELLGENFEKSLKQSEEIINHIISLKG